MFKAKFAVIFFEINFDFFLLSSSSSSNKMKEFVCHSCEFEIRTLCWNRHSMIIHLNNKKREKDINKQKIFILTVKFISLFIYLFFVVIIIIVIRQNDHEIFQFSLVIQIKEQSIQVCVCMCIGYENNRLNVFEDSFG